MPPFHSADCSLIVPEAPGCIHSLVWMTRDPDLAPQDMNHGRPGGRVLGSRPRATSPTAWGFGQVTLLLSPGLPRPLASNPVQGAPARMAWGPQPFRGMTRLLQLEASSRLSCQCAYSSSPRAAPK